MGRPEAAGRGGGYSGTLSQMLPLYRARFLGHKTALCGLMRGDDGGHPIPPCFGGTSVAVLFQQPPLVVALEVRPDGGADLLDVLVDAPEDDLFLQGSDEALGDAVGFRLADEGEAGRHTEKRELVLEVLGHERAAVVMAEEDAAGGIRADGSKDLADGQRQRLGGSVAVAVLGDDEQRDVAVLDRRHNSAVGAPHDVRRIGRDGAGVVIGGTWWAAMRGEQMVLTHDPQQAGAADPDTVDHPQPRPDLAVALAGPRRAGQIPADRSEQLGIGQRRFRAASTGRALAPRLAPGVVERGSRNAPDR